MKPIVPSGSTQSSLLTIPGHAGLDNSNAPDGGAPVLLADAAGTVLLVAGAVLEGAVSDGIAPVMSVVGAPLDAGPVALASGAELIAGGALLITGGAELTAGAVLICGAALVGAGALVAAGADVPGAAVVACVSRSAVPVPHAVANARAQTVAAVKRAEDVTEREESAIAALYHTLLPQVPALEAEVASASFNAVKFSLQGVCEPRLQPRTFPGSFRHRDENSPEKSDA